MFVVDTNILIYGANGDALEHATCHALLDEWRGQATIWYVTWGIVYEFLRIVTHPRVFKHPWQTNDAWAYVNTLLSSPGLAVLSDTDNHSKVAEDFFSEHPFIMGNLLFDAHTAILMREHGISNIYTRDSDFHKFRSINVIDPLM